MLPIQQHEECFYRSLSFVNQFTFVKWKVAKKEYITKSVLSCYRSSSHLSIHHCHCSHRSRSSGSCDCCHNSLCHKTASSTSQTCTNKHSRLQILRRQSSDESISDVHKYIIFNSSCSLLQIFVLISIFFLTIIHLLYISMHRQLASCCSIVILSCTLYTCSLVPRLLFRLENVVWE